jgi:hypothetical protein
MDNGPCERGNKHASLTKCTEFSWLAEKLSAFQERLCSKELSFILLGTSLARSPIFIDSVLLNIFQQLWEHQFSINSIFPYLYNEKKSVLCEVSDNTVCSI